MKHLEDHWLQHHGHHNMSVVLDRRAIIQKAQEVVKRSHQKMRERTRLART
jgi:hypothetical protein